MQFLRELLEPQIIFSLSHQSCRLKNEQTDQEFELMNEGNSIIFHFYTFLMLTPTTPLQWRL